MMYTQYHPVCQVKMSASVHYGPIHQTYCLQNIRTVYMVCTCLSPDRCRQGSENETMYVHMCVHKYVSVNCVQECFIVYGITCVCVCVRACVCVRVQICRCVSMLYVRACVLCAHVCVFKLCDALFSWLSLYFSLVGTITHWQWFKRKLHLTVCQIAV